MQRTPVESSNISSIGYSEKQEILEVKFLSGAVYQYFGVKKDTFNGLMGAESHGKYLHQNIKLGGYKYKKVAG